MKKIFTTLFLVSFMSAIGWSQINDESPYPIDFVIESPAVISGIYDYSTMTADASGDPGIWGPTLANDVRGEIVWAFNATDSLGCEPITQDLTGKMALIRRGACNFSIKIWGAEQAGAAGVIIVNHYDDATQDEQSLVGMLWGDNREPITIPAVFVSRQTGEAILSVLDSGEPVMAAFDLRNLSDNQAPYAYQTPLSQAISLDEISVNYFNEDSLKTVEPTVKATIVEPDGTVTENSIKVSVAPFSDSTILFPGFLPTQLGMHSVTFTSDLNTDTLQSPFEMTEHTFAVDRGAPYTDITISNDNFVNGGQEFHVGSAYYPGPNGGTAVGTSFGIGNIDSIFTGNPLADLFSLVLYDMDPNETGVLGATYDDFQVVGFGGYDMTGDEGENEILYTELFDPVQLRPNSGYAVMVQYLGETAGLGIPPSFTAAGATNYPLPGTLVFANSTLFTGGWNSNNNNVVRLHLDGFISSTNDLKKLDASKVSIFPNPVEDQLNMKLELAENSEIVRIVITDMTGRHLYNQKFENVRSQSFDFNVSSFANGAYLMNVITEEGFRVDKFVVNR